MVCICVEALAPPAFIARRKASGATEGRLEFGLLLPRGPVAPQATFELRCADLTPWTTALQIFA